MNCEETTDLLSDRLKGALTAEDEQRLEAHLAACPACSEEARAIVELWNDLGTIDDLVPRDRMRARFHAALAAYEERTRGTALDRGIARLWPQRPTLQAGVAALLLMVGVLVGQWLPSGSDREIAALREEIRAVGLVLLAHQSAAERLRGIEWSRRVESELVVNALFETVRYDTSLNVRLAAVEALSDRLDQPRVRVGLTDALERQDSPLLQVTLAQVLLEGNVDGSVAVIRRILEREGLDPSVRDYLRTALGEAGESRSLPDV